MKILLTNDVAIKMKYYTKFAPGEVSGMAKTSINEDGDIVVDDIALFDQQCTSGTTDLDDASMAKFMYEMGQRGESLKAWNLWWHTHGHLGVFWSGTDTGTINAHKDVYDFLVSVVTNKAGDFKGRIDTFPKDLSPAGLDIPSKHEDLAVEIYMDTEQLKSVEAEILEVEIEKEAVKKYVEELDKKISELNDGLLIDEDAAVVCKAEVESKVRQKVYSNVQSTNYRGGRSWSYEKGWASDKGQKVSSKKKESYYERDEKEQRKFEKVLDDIMWGYPVCDVDDDTEYFEDDLVSPMDFMESCPECQNPILHCDCPDALFKYGDIIRNSGVYYDGFGWVDEDEDKLTRDYKRIMREEGFGLQGSLLPRVYKNGK